MYIPAHTFLLSLLLLPAWAVGADEIAPKAEISAPARADDAVANENGPAASPEGAKSAIEAPPLLNRSRGYLGKNYIDLTQTIDSFLAGKRLEREYNDSFLKLLTQTTSFEHSASKHDIRLKGKLDLPGTKRRYRLFIDSDPDEQKSIEDRSRSISRGERLQERSSVAGIEFAKRKPLTRWKSSLSLGGKLSGGVKLLGRARLRKHWILNDKWTSYFRQDLWHLDDIGWGETSRAELTRTLGDKRWIQFLTEVQYQDDDPAWEYVHSWRIDQVLSDKHALTYKIGITGETLDGILEDNRFLSFSWRSRVYDDWAFLHLTPELYFASEDGYKSEGAFTIKLEIFLTD